MQTWRRPLGRRVKTARATDRVRDLHVLRERPAVVRDAQLPVAVEEQELNRAAERRVGHVELRLAVRQPVDRDLMVVSFHFGREWKPSTRLIEARMIRAHVPIGAAAIPHVSSRETDSRVSSSWSHRTKHASAWDRRPQLLLTSASKTQTVSRKPSSRLSREQTFQPATGSLSAMPHAVVVAP